MIGKQTTLKAAGTFLSTLLGGFFLGTVLSVVIAVYYSGLIRAGGGSVLSLKLSSFIALLLYCFIIAYGALSFFYAWRRAIKAVVEIHSLKLADRLTSFLATRVPSSFDSIKTELLKEAAAVKSESFWLRKVSDFAVKRLPWSDILSEWKAGDTASLAPMLSQRIAVALNEMVTPRLLPLALCAAVHLSLLGLGIWALP